MSVATDLQHLVAVRLADSATATLGDGVLTVLPLPHGLAMEYLPALSITEGERQLVLGTDFSVARADENTLQITSLVGAPGAGAWAASVARLRTPAPIVEFQPKDLAIKIAAAVKNHGLCIHVMPPLEKKVKAGHKVLFFEEAEVRIRIIEQHATNRTGVSAYDLKDDIMVGMHWQFFPTISRHPLFLSAHPIDEVGDAEKRILDVVFTAVYGAQPLPQA